jgi:hypothetical protein
MYLTMVASLRLELQYAIVAMRACYVCNVGPMLFEALIPHVTIAGMFN